MVRRCRCLARSASWDGFTKRARRCAWRWLTNRSPNGIRRTRCWRLRAMPQADYKARIAKLQEAMKEFGLRAIVVESGPAMQYLTGVRWGRSERTFAVVITQTGDPAYVLPGFEEMRARELIQVGEDIRVWQEDESPYQRIAGTLKDRGVALG